MIDMSKVILDTDADPGVCAYCGNPIAQGAPLIVVCEAEGAALQRFHKRCRLLYTLDEHQRHTRRLERLAGQRRRAGQ